MSSGRHRDTVSHPTDTALDDGHVLGYIVATVADLAGILTAFEGRQAWVRSTNAVYTYNASGVWIPGAGSPITPNPYTVLTSTGGTILPGTTNINISSDSTQTVSNAIDLLSTFTVFNSQPFKATVLCPTGWQFGDGNHDFDLGLNASAKLFYRGDQTIIIESQSAGYVP